MAYRKGLVRPTVALDERIAGRLEDVVYKLTKLFRKAEIPLSGLSNQNILYTSLDEWLRRMEINVADGSWKAGFRAKINVYAQLRIVYYRFQSANALILFRCFPTWSPRSGVQMATQSALRLLKFSTAGEASTLRMNTRGRLQEALLARSTLIAAAGRARDDARDAIADALRASGILTVAEVTASDGPDGSIVLTLRPK